MNQEVFNEDIISQLIALCVADRDKIINAMQNVTNPNDINEVMEYINNENNGYQLEDTVDDDDDDGDQTVEIDEIFKLLPVHHNYQTVTTTTTTTTTTTAAISETNVKLPCSLSEIKTALLQCPLIWNLDVPDTVVNIIAFCSLTEFELELNESLVLSCSAPEYSKGYGLNKLFTASGVYCTQDTRGARYNEAEIVIQLSTKNHCLDTDTFDEHGFIITEVKIKPPGWGFTAPLKTFMMWIFNDKNLIPDKKEIREKYGGQIDVETLDVYNKKEDRHLKYKDIEKKCVVCIDNIKKSDPHHKCKLYDDMNSSRVIKAKYILIKLMTPSGWDNVDTQHFAIKVMRL